jgi:hypothetical protein
MIFDFENILVLFSNAIASKVALWGPSGHAWWVIYIPGSIREL